MHEDTSYITTLNKEIAIFQMMNAYFGTIFFLWFNVLFIRLQYSSEEEEEDLESTMLNMNKKKKVDVKSVKRLRQCLNTVVMCSVKRLRQCPNTVLIHCHKTLLRQCLNTVLIHCHNTI